MNKKTTLPMWKAATLKKTEVTTFKRKYRWDFTTKEIK